MIHGAITVYLIIGCIGAAFLVETADDRMQVAFIVLGMAVGWLPLMLVFLAMIGFYRARYWWKGW